MLCDIVTLFYIMSLFYLGNIPTIIVNKDFCFIFHYSMLRSASMDLLTLPETHTHTDAQTMGQTILQYFVSLEGLVKNLNSGY